MIRKLLKERLAEAMDAANLDAEGLAQAASVPVGDVVATLADGTLPTRPKEERIAKALDVSPAYLLDWDSLYPFPQDEESAVAYNVLDTAQVTADGEIEEDFMSDYEVIPASWLMDRDPTEFFAMRVPDDAMSPLILRGDLLLVHKAPAADSGSVAVVLVDGSRATVRRIFYDETGTLIRLETPDASELNKNITGEALERCHVLGRVTRVVRTLH